MQRLRRLFSRRRRGHSTPTAASAIEDESQHEASVPVPLPIHASETLLGQMGSLFLSARLSDVLLKLVVKGDGGDDSDEPLETPLVPAHSFVLRLRSAYFESRFAFEARQGDGSTADGHVLELHLDQRLASDFMPVLEFLYNDRIELDAENVVDVLRAADYFQISSLAAHCRYALESRTLLSVENVLPIFIQLRATCPHDEEAQQIALDFIDHHANELFNGVFGDIRETTARRIADLSGLDPRAFKAIFCRDSLRTSEVVGFQAALASTGVIEAADRSEAFRRLLHQFGRTRTGDWLYVDHIDPTVCLRCRAVECRIVPSLRSLAAISRQIVQWDSEATGGDNANASKRPSTSSR